jgi:hypothetical protein
VCPVDADAAVRHMHDVDDYLLKVLNELRRRTAQDTGENDTADPTKFQSSTLDELTRRITFEKGLKEEIARLARDVSDFYMPII